MERSGFFNSKYTDGAYDRPYDANDYSSQLGAVIGNGVARTGEDDLKVKPYGAYGYSVNIGRAWINGCWYHNNSIVRSSDLDNSWLAVPQASDSGARIDLVILRLSFINIENTPERSIRLAYKTGSVAPSGTPTAPTLVRDDSTYEICLAEIHVSRGATTITEADIVDTRGDRDKCGWMYSIVGADEYFTSLDNAWNEHIEDIDDEWQDMKDAFSSVTLFKKYEARTTLQGTVTRMNVQMYIPQFKPGLDILEVFCNGWYLNERQGEEDTQDYDYYLEGSYIVFTMEKPAGNEISFSIYKSIDSRGDVPALMDLITEVQNKVATFQDMTEYNYFCTGIDDNHKISTLVQNFCTGVDNGQQIKINVYGELDAITPFNGGTAGAGSSSTSRYRWFDFGSNQGTRRVILDFTNCHRIHIALTSGSYNVLFNAKHLTLIGASFLVEGTAQYTEIQGFSSTDGDIRCEGCSFIFRTYQNSYVAQNGLFENCYVDITQEAGETACFDTHSSGLIIARGGEYKAYSKGSANSYVFKQTQSGSAMLLDGINCPTVAKDGYKQTHATYATGGTAIVRNAITALTVQGGTISSTIAASKPRRG